MTGYRIYLTKSNEVAMLLAEANRVKIGTGSVVGVSHGSVGKNHKIPAIYHDDGWFYCLLEYSELSRPEYEIVFA